MFLIPEKDHYAVNSGTKKIKKGIKIGLTVKVTAMVAVIILLVAAISISIIYSLSYNALKMEIENKLMVLASGVSSMLDAEKLKTLQSETDEGSANYLELQKTLQKFKDASMGKIKFLYTLKIDGDKCMYILDAVPIDDTDNHSTIGSDFSLTDYPSAINGFKEPTAEKELTEDKVFKLWSQSGYAPIKDNSGKVIGAVGLDMDVTTLKKDESAMVMAGGVSLGISLILAILLGVLFSSYLTRPIVLLTKVTKTVAEGDLEANVTIKRKDEFGQLADSFNKMTNDLKVSRDALKKYSIELEEKVVERTSQLSAINREIKDILDNMSQAIFTIDHEFKFNDQHSRFAYDIFGDIAFTSKSILDVFFNEEGQIDQRKYMNDWLTRVSGSIRAEWGNLEALQPVREVVINRKDATGICSTKYVQVDFQPIFDFVGIENIEQVIKVMVIVQDITERKVLQMEMSKKEKEYKDNINQIIEVIKMDEELFQDFISECQENLINFEPKLIQLKNDKENMEIINDLYRIMHTIKGNAGAFKLERIVGQAHSIENVFSAITNGT